MLLCEALNDRLSTRNSTGGFTDEIASRCRPLVYRADMPIRDAQAWSFSLDRFLVHLKTYNEPRGEESRQSESIVAGNVLSNSAAAVLRRDKRRPPCAQSSGPRGRSHTTRADQKAFLVLPLLVVYEQEGFSPAASILRGSKPQAEEACAATGDLGGQAMQGVCCNPPMAGYCWGLKRVPAHSVVSLRIHAALRRDAGLSS